MSKQIKKLRNKLIDTYKNINKKQNANAQVSLLVGISQLHH